MWIREYRERMGLELDEFARVVNMYRRYAKEKINGIVTNALIHLLEVDDRTVTHPVLANAIASVCGATPEQRDSIVSEKYRGTWTPDPMREAIVEKALWKVMGIRAEQGQAEQASTQMDPAPFYASRPVVKLDRLGNTIQLYESLSAAARENSLKPSYVRRRCGHHIYTIDSMFTSDGFTFRYADEWDRMSQKQKLDDVRGVGIPQ